ncbi:MAG: hypothetical protein QXJ56_07390 [Ignisphaera sp.]
MSGKVSIEIAPCILCGRPSPVVNVSGKTIAICYECIPVLDEVFHPLAEKIRSVSRPPKTAPKKITLEELKEKIGKTVEKKGRISLKYYSERYRIGIGKIRELAEALVKEKGYVITKVKDKEFLEKPTQTTTTPT